MTEQTQPTDAEIEQLYQEETGFSLKESPAALLDFARAVLAKWGTPAGAGEVVAWMDDFGNTFPLAANKGAGSWLDAHKRNWKPLYTTPQPTQAQAGAAPMSEKFLQMMTPAKAEPSDFAAGVRFAEAHHGIKGADHG